MRISSSTSLPAIPVWVLLVTVGIGSWGATRWYFAESSPETLTAGTALSQIAARDSAGLDVKIDLTGTSTVLYVMSTTCKWCEVNEEMIALAAPHMAKKYRMVGLLIDAGSPRFDRRSRYPFPVYGDLARDVVERYRLNVTPQTIVVESGRVKRVWLGAYSEKRAKAIAQYFAFTFSAQG